MKYGSEVKRSCKFCRKRKMKCSGERPWCGNCKDKNKPCVYDTGTIRIKKPEEDSPPVAEREAGTLPLPGTSRSCTLYHELNSLYVRLWGSSRAYWASQNASYSLDALQQATAIDYQHGLSQILRRTIDSLAVKVLPFGDQLQLSNVNLGVSQASNVTPEIEGFTPISRRIYYGDDGFDHARLPQLIDLAYKSHPFLSVIVSRTLFLKDYHEDSHDRQLLDCILISALGLREHFFAGAVGAPPRARELPELNNLIPKFTDTFNKVKLGMLNASKMHVCIQCIMLLAWHELASGWVKRASTWWTFACSLIVQARYLAAQEDQLECIVNGIDKATVREEEMNNMQAISQLVVMWLQLTLGPIPTHHALLSRSHVGAEDVRPRSVIWDLDEISGNISVIENFQHSSSVVGNIEAMLGSLTGSLTDWKIANATSVRRTAEPLNDRDLDWIVNNALYQARTMYSGKILAVLVISFVMLIKCLQATPQDKKPMSEQKIDTIIKVCAAISLQLRDIFGDSEVSNEASAGYGEVAGLRAQTKASSFTAMEEALIAITIVEAIAYTFTGLLEPTGSLSSSAIRSDASEAFTLSAQARQHVVEKMGIIMGILCTIIDCYDNIPKRGKRANRISTRLNDLRKGLEDLNVQADVSFAFDIALSSASSGSSQEASQEANVGIKQETSLDLSSTTNQLMPSQNSFGFQPTGPWTHEEVARFGSSSYIRHEAGSQYNRAESSHHSPQYSYQHAAQQPPGQGHVRYGPGPLSIALRQDRGTAEGSGETTYPLAFRAEPSQAYGIPAPRNPTYPSSMNVTNTGTSSSAQATSDACSYAAESSATQTCATAPFSGATDPAAGYAATRIYMQAMQGYTSSRVAPPTHTVDQDGFQVVERRGIEGLRGAYGSKTAQDYYHPPRQASTNELPALWKAEPQEEFLDSCRKRARLDESAFRPTYSNSRQIADSSRRNDYRGESSSGRDTLMSWTGYGNNTGQTTVTLSMGTESGTPWEEGGHHLQNSTSHAAQALASIQQIEPLTDTTASATSESDWTRDKGKGRATTGTDTDNETSPYSDREQRYHR